MGVIAAILALFLLPQATPQEPEPAHPATVPPATAPARDVIRLDIGTEIEGRIVQETSDYVEIELSPGTRVGFSKSRTVSIVRGSPPHPSADAPAVASDPETHRDDWSVLHDADGRVVGWLHGTVTRDEQQEIRISEEWRLEDGSGTTELTFLEVLDPEGAPKSCFYHERIRAKRDDRVQSERIVRAIVDGNQLKVRRQTSDSNEQQTYDIPEGMRFPLELQESLRRRPAGSQGSETHVVFDPRESKFVRRTFDFGRVRRVAGSDGPTRVRVVTEATGNGENSEWLDAAAHVVRREINGPSLVAVPSTETEARRLFQRGDVEFPAAFRAEPGGRFGLWLPHPGWSFDADSADGTLSAHDPLDDAAVSVVRLDQLASDVLMPTAADALARWLALVQPGLHITSREQVRVRNVDATRFRATYDVVTEGRSRVFMLVADLFADPEGVWHAVCGCAPKETWPQVESDVDWIVEHVEIRRDGFAPELRGPLAAKQH